MEEPKHERIAGTFVTHDRTQAAIYVRMEENTLTKPRLEVINDLRSIVWPHARNNGEELCIPM